LLFAKLATYSWRSAQVGRRFPQRKRANCVTVKIALLEHVPEEDSELEVIQSTAKSGRFSYFGYDEDCRSNSRESEKRGFRTEHVFCLAAAKVFTIVTAEMSTFARADIMLFCANTKCQMAPPRAERGSTSASRLDQLLRPLLQDAVASDPEEDRSLCHPLGAPQVQAVASEDQGGTRLV
jgi:hypothetical protein